MADEIIKPTEESIVTKTSATTEEIPVVIPESTLTPTSNQQTPTPLSEPIVVTEPVVIEAPKESAVEVPEPEQIEAKPLSAPIDSDPTLITSPSPLEPNFEARESVDAETTVEVLTPTSTQQEAIPAEEPAVVPIPILITNHLPLEPNPRPYSLDPKLNKAIEAFVRGMNNSKQNLILAKKAVQAKMMKKVYRIMDLFKKKSSIKNDDVEKFLHTSDKTATKYLNILTKEGKVKREGNPHAPHYIKTE